MVSSQGTVINYSEMAQLPHFNPDLDVDNTNTAVANWRRLLNEANGVLICTPEYAKGIPGSLKNALDWVVSSGEFVNKPVAFISASPHPDGGATANNSLVGTLSMMSALVVKGLSVPLINKKLD
jgi:NAD(P)H-dependent FMN reductase